MYSIVMLTAMSAGADVTPPPAPAMAAPMVAGCSGCSGWTYSTSCHGSSCYGSCHGSSCHGGLFGFRNSCHGGFLGLRSSCHGCSGYSCSGYNCFSSGYSCHGSSCHGSCHGSCFGSCHGCSGSTWGPAVAMAPYTLHGYNSHAVYGTVTINPNLPPAVVIPIAPVSKGSDSTPMGANIRFQLPAEAKLFVDGKPAAGSGAERAFYTPPLAVGQKFFYDVKAEITVDGKLVVEEKRVIVEAGANLTETFPKLVAAAKNGTTVAGK